MKSLTLTIEKQGQKHIIKLNIKTLVQKPSTNIEKKLILKLQIEFSLFIVYMCLLDIAVL